MQVSAVNVSLTAGESARMAISTSWSMANTGVLDERAVGAGHVGSASAPATSGAACRRPDRGQGSASDDEVTRAVGQSDHGVGALADGDELTEADELQVAAGRGRHDDAHLGAARATSSDGALPIDRGGVEPGTGRQGEFGVDGEREVVGDPCDDLRQLDRFGDVVDEVDEDQQVERAARPRTS